MKLLKDTGSLTNWLMANPKYKEPKVGMGVTELLWTDRHAWMITEVDKDKKGFTMTRMAPKLVGNYYSQNYVYEDENGKPLMGTNSIHVRYRYKNWHYAPNGGTIHLSIGHAEEYEDPSF